MVPSATKPRLLLLGSDHPTTWIVYNRLVREFGLFDAIIEETVPKATLVRNRARKLGWPAVLSQMAFVALIRPVLYYQSGRRVKQICRMHDMEPHEPMTAAVRRVESINGAEARGLISKSGADVVIVNGTRIIKAQVLASVKAPFINTHQGITPMYRGAHGSYWALHENDAEHCGVTIHLVDEGIDTGNVIAQATVTPEASDTYITYPYLQTAAALPLLSAAVRDAAAGTLNTHVPEGPSAVWYHPGLFQYVRARLRGVR